LARPSSLPFASPAAHLTSGPPRRPRPLVGCRGRPQGGGRAGQRPYATLNPPT